MRNLRSKFKIEDLRVHVISVHNMTDAVQVLGVVVDYIKICMENLILIL